MNKKEKRELNSIEETIIKLVRERFNEMREADYFERHMALSTEDKVSENEIFLSIHIADTAWYDKDQEENIQHPVLQHGEKNVLYLKDEI
jgi:hypothetical protein